MPRTLFFNGIEYSANDFVDLFKGLTNNGIRSKDDLKVTASVPNSLTVDITPGKLFLSGYFITFDTTSNIPITANTSGYNRKDRICVKVDTNNQTTSIVAIEGVPSSSPVSPSVPTVDGELYATIAIVTVGNNVNSITQDNIYDARIVTKIWDDYNSSFKDGATGYLKLPNGFLIQWNAHSVNFNNVDNVTVTHNFPIAFPNKCVYIGANITTGSSVTFTNLRVLSNSQYESKTKNISGNSSTAATFCMFAIGY